MYTSTNQPDPTRWDEFVNQHHQGHFLQTAAWGEIKSAFGWEAQQIALSDASGAYVAGAQILYRELPLGAGKLAYVPFGPVVDWNNKTLVRDVFLKMDKTAKRHGAAFLKVEPGYGIDTAFLRELKCHPSPQTVQPPRTIVLDIYGKDEEGNRLPPEFILKRMNQMTRRNIRKSEKSGISIREGTRADVAKFYALLETTSTRQDFGVHVQAYYEKVYDAIIAAPKPPAGVLLLASYTDETTGLTQDLAGVFVFALGIIKLKENNE